VGVETAEPTGTAWVVDHYKSDPNTHVYCAECYSKIPPFLVRYENEVTEWEKVQHADFDWCEGCGRSLRPDEP
jgi:Pyruvate/2-oxoacid:ferredoxin oxidoreductase delta subunit